MKKIISALICGTIFTVMSIAGAADKVKPTKSAKPINDDSSEPFDTTVGKLPPNYPGHSILGVLQKIVLQRPKGEFEKTEEYETRIDKWKGAAFIGEIAPIDTMAFELSEFLARDAMSVKYDADRSVMDIKVSFENRVFVYGKSRWLETFYQSKNLGSRVAVTRMGVKFKVTSHRGLSVGLAIDDGIEDVSFSKPMTRDEALKVKPYLRAFAIVTLDEPYKIESSTETTASLDSPDEWVTRFFGLSAKLSAIWLVNKKTGEVLAKSEAPFPTCRYNTC